MSDSRRRVPPIAAPLTSLPTSVSHVLTNPVYSTERPHNRPRLLHRHLPRRPPAATRVRALHGQQWARRPRRPRRRWGARLDDAHAHQLGPRARHDDRHRRPRGARVDDDDEQGERAGRGGAARVRGAWARGAVWGRYRDGVQAGRGAGGSSLLCRASCMRLGGRLVGL